MQKDGLGLYPCPFCGSDNVHIIRISLNDARTFWSIECRDCKATLLRKTEAEAKAAWNSRYSEAAGDLPRLKNLHAALTYCGSKNTFPSNEEPCRKELCPLFPFHRDENAVCVTCIETVIREASDIVKTLTDQQTKME
mgnify:CR=1 FL=1